MNGTLAVTSNTVTDTPLVTKTAGAVTLTLEQDTN